MSNVTKLNRAQPQMDVDPEVEELAALVQQSGLSDEAIADRVTKARHISMSPRTVRRLRELATQRPQNYTIKWVGWGIGYVREWRKL